MLDQFTDFKDNQIYAPVRQSARKIILQIAKYNQQQMNVFYNQIVNEFVLIIMKSQEYFWIMRYNALLLIQCFIQSCDDCELKLQLFNQIKQVPVQMIDCEDEIKCVACELITLLFQYYALDSKIIHEVIQKLMSNLKASEILNVPLLFMIKLLTTIYTDLFTITDLSEIKSDDFFLVFDVATVLPFAFHKIVNVRNEFYALIIQFSKLFREKCKTIAKTSFYQRKESLTQIIMQALSMEEDKILLKLLFECLDELIKLFSNDISNYLLF
jgi:hypothetical protein